MSGHPLPDGAALDAVIFDMDGLMLDTEQVSLRAWTQATRDLGLEMAELHAHAIIGMNQAGSRAYLREHLGAAFPWEDCARRTHEIYLQILHDEGIGLKPGLTELLDWLDAHRIPLAVATSTRHELAIGKLTDAGIIERFTQVVGGDQVAHGKPAPDIYLEAAARLGIRPGVAVALEDSFNGVRSAHAAGIPVIMVPDLVAATPAISRLAVATLGSLHEAQVWLADHRRVGPA